MILFEGIGINQNCMFFRDIAAKESLEAQHEMVDVMDDLGVCPLPDASPSFR